MKLTSVVLCSLAIVCLLVGSASAGLIVEVKAVAGPGYTVSEDGKTVTVADPAATIAMQVWATLPQVGTDTTLSHYKFQSLYGGVGAFELKSSVASGKLQLDESGNLNGYVTPFTTLSTPAFVSDTQLGMAAGQTSASGVAGLNYRAGSLQGATKLPMSYQLGVFNWQMTGIANPLGGQFGTIQFNLPGSDANIGTWLSANAVQHPNTVGAMSTGAPIVLMTAVPEPSTIILLGMGALALVFVRRRK